MNRLLLFPKIHRAYREAVLYFSGMVGEYGVNVEEGNLLVYLTRFAPCTISQISKVIGLKPSTLTSMLDRLEKKGLVRRLPNPEDRRSLLVELDEEGKHIAQKIIELAGSLETDIMDQISERDLEGFLSTMKAVGNVTKVSLKD